MDEWIFNPATFSPKFFSPDLFRIKVLIRANQLHTIEFITDQTQFTQSSKEKSALMKEICADLEQYFTQGQVDNQGTWDKYRLAEAFPRVFSMKVMELTTGIPAGTVQQYGDLARSLGSRAYQAIGNCLRRNPFPILIPCHRVVRAKGKIGGFMGKTDPNSKELQVKQQLLAFEQFMNTR